MAKIIESQKIVKIHYTLKDKDGNLIDTSRNQEPLEYMHGIGSLIPGLEKELEGKAAGDKFNVTVEPKEGYGEYDENLVQEVPRSQFDVTKPIEIGDTFQAQTATGPFMVRVTKVTDEQITVDGNHELAGKELFFEVEIIDIRDPSEEELQALEGGCGCGGSCGGSCGSGCGGCEGCGE